MDTYSRYKDGEIWHWKVERLWQLSKDLPVKQIPIASIGSFDKVCWFDGVDSIPSCKAVAMHARQIFEADLSFPIILASDGELMDGMHRVAKAWALGEETIAAVQFSKDPLPDKIEGAVDKT